MATLYHYLDCPFCFKTRAYLGERSIPWTSMLVDRSHPPPELPALNPLGRLPVWVTDEGKPIFGSNTIIDFLEATQPGDGLLPTDPLQRARCWMADEMADKGLLEPLMALDREQREHGDASTWNLERYRRDTTKIRRQLHIFEQLLGGRAWLVGDSLTVADLAVALPLTILERFGLDLAGLTGLQDLTHRLEKRPAILAARKNPAADVGAQSR